MKNIISMLLSAVIVALTTLTGNSQDFTINIEEKSKYVLMDNAGVFHDSPVIQGDITATFKNGAYACVWFSDSPESSWGNDLGDEIDFIVGWSGDIGHGFTMNASVFYFYEPADFFPDIWYPKVTISHEVLGWNIGLQAGVYLPVDGSEGGWLIGPTASKTFQVTEKVSVPITFKLIYDDGGFGFDKGFIPSISTGLNYEVNKNLTLGLSIAGCTTIGIDDTRKEEFVWGVNASYKF